MTSHHPEQVIAERYRLSEPLGKGGMATVWKAEHVELGSELALKLIDEEIVRKPSALSRFRREAKAAAALDSPYVVKIFDYGVDGSIPYIAMELMRGESLGDRLDREGALSAEETWGVVRHVARALEKAHAAGIVHRDLKPDNIFLVAGEHADERIAKVLDFGIAKSPISEEDTDHTKTGSMVGSPCYVSPEQARGAKTLDHRTDLWSLGVVTYECLLGERPFEAESLGDLIVQICVDPIPVPSERGPVPSGFDEWFARCVVRDLSVRFPDARQLASELERVLTGVVSEEPDADPRPSRSETVGVSGRPRQAQTTLGDTTAELSITREARRFPVLPVAGGALLVASISAVVVFSLSGTGTPATQPEAPSATARASSEPTPSDAPRPPRPEPEVAPAMVAPAPEAPTSPASAKPASPPVSRPAPRPRLPPKPAPTGKPTVPVEPDYGF